MDPDHAVKRVFDAIVSHELTRDDLSARKITAFLGQSTIVLYHHFGSLDGFLIRVDGLAWRHLAITLERRRAHGGALEDLAAAYVDFALEHPDLYWLMTMRPFDRKALRAMGRLRQAAPLWSTFVAMVAEAGSSDPEADTRALFAGLHGVASLASSGRANIAEEPAADVEVAKRTARRLARAIVPATRLRR